VDDIVGALCDRAAEIPNAAGTARMKARVTMLCAGCLRCRVSRA